MADTFICCRVADARYVVPGSLTAKCAKCGERVWVAPSSLEIRQDNPDSQFVCNQCAFAQMEQCGGEVEIMELTPAQIKEVEEYRRTGHAN